ncbi:leucine-rich repeat protein 1 [Copidosoma floridanum]|uniref:leucine-rich repeat protein 1 n=1 Tax=Copidosoma floridanum TaxID=29053 RepID=UPI0006C9556E|nr:leucine-rich repeat protein 1 [Copidosoma floridanum]
MKLMCSTVVEPSYSPPTRKQFLKSCLSIGRQSVKDDNIYILLQQSNKNKNGTKYRVNNIETIFSKFVHEGMATIRFKSPVEDISIRCDPLQLKSFLHVLKLALSGKMNPAVMNLSNLEPKKINTLLKTKIVIKSAANYPVLEGFPRTTEELHLAALERRSFDRQILKLQSLKFLNLSDNQLTSLPQELGMLPNLQELHLANNQLGKSPISKWSWMNGSKIVKNLHLLNMSSNQLKYVPHQLNKLQNLVSLFLNDNSISVLPQGIGNLLKLKFLNIAKNNLTYMPGSVRNLRLTDLNISDNPWKCEVDNDFYCNIKVPSLLDIAAQVIKRKRIYYDASVIPFNLVPFLDKANYCLCGLACFGCFYRTFKLAKYNSIAQNTKFSNVRSLEILYECYFCSARCIRLYSNAW